MSEFPKNLSYTQEHEWVEETDGVAAVGITHHAIQELGDLVYLDLPGVGDSVEAGESCGEIESTKAVSELFAPLSGEVVEVNEAAVDAPESIADAPYTDGWLFKIKLDGEQPTLLTVEQYEALLDS